MGALLHTGAILGRAPLEVKGLAGRPVGLPAQQLHRSAALTARAQNGQQSMSARAPVVREPRQWTTHTHTSMHGVNGCRAQVCCWRRCMRASMDVMPAEKGKRAEEQPDLCRLLKV